MSQFHHQVAVFRNKNGNLGFIQKYNNQIDLFIETNLSIYSIEETYSWDEWLNSRKADEHDKLNEDITAEAIEFYLLYSAESVNHEVAEFYINENPGKFHPRIARGRFRYNYVDAEFLQDIRAFNNIQSSLDTLFDYVDPSDSNFLCYGHKFRELLILACTEVECLWAKLLIANGIVKDRYTTTDYFKCHSALMLNKYEVKLKQYPNVEAFKPFLNWESVSPTKSIDWYAAYNLVKHNRSLNIDKANFKHLLNAIAAIHILLESQYSHEIFQQYTRRTEDKSMFVTINRPQFACKEISAPLLSSKGGFVWTGGHNFQFEP